MNTYTVEFFMLCPANGIRVKYLLRISKKSEALSVEKILKVLAAWPEGFHEPMADYLFARFGGKQTLTADHHGVRIETTRP